MKEFIITALSYQYFPSQKLGKSFKPKTATYSFYVLKSQRLLDSTFFSPFLESSFIEQESKQSHYIQLSVVETTEILRSTFIVFL